MTVDRFVEERLQPVHGVGDRHRSTLQLDLLRSVGKVLLVPAMSFPTVLALLFLPIFFPAI
jgi:hypothetical protein